MQEFGRGVLADLRRFNTSLINIESKFMTVGDNWIQEIGVEWGGIDNPGVPFTDLDDVTSGLEDNAGLGLDNGGTGDASSSPSSVVIALQSLGPGARHRLQKTRAHRESPFPPEAHSLP